MNRQNNLNPADFRFRGLHPNVFIGTASDRYAGWIGQIYSKGRYEDKLSSRTRKIGGKSFKVNVLPLESVDEYFDHFRVLEIDYTFYAPLSNEKGEPTQNQHVLSRYHKYLQENDFLILKVPQMIFAQKLLRGGKYIPNEHYLNARSFTCQFYEPANNLLGSHLKGLVFEQEYQRAQERKPPKELAAELDRFFGAIPRDDRYHVEFRTEAYLSRPVFDVLNQYGVGQVLSHWTWLPPLEKQFDKSGRKIINAGRQTVIRLMTPLGTRYEDAYARAYPFDKIVDGLFSPQMVGEASKLMHTLADQGTQVHVIVNNRAGGNAPLIAQKLAEAFTETAALI